MSNDVIHSISSAVLGFAVFLWLIMMISIGDSKVQSIYINIGFEIQVTFSIQTILINTALIFTGGLIASAIIVRLTNAETSMMEIMRIVASIVMFYNLISAIVYFFGSEPLLFSIITVLFIGVFTLDFIVKREDSAQ